MFLSNKKGQITFFILVGLLLFLVSIFVFYISSVQEKAERRVDIHLLTSDVIQSSAIQRFTNTCLENSLEKGLFFIGRQGGYIYKGQMGSIVGERNYSVVEFNNESYTYLIVPNERYPTPLYPCDEECNFSLSKDFENIEGYFYGKFRLLPHLFKEVITPKGKSKIAFSIQEQLEVFVSVQTALCMNLTQLEERPEFSGIIISQGNATTSIKFTDKEVIANLNFPLTFSVKGQVPRKHFYNFQTSSPVRFKKIYDAVDDLIVRDIQFLDFDIVDDTLRGRYASDPYEKKLTLDFNVIRSNAKFERVSYPFDLETDLLVLTDDRSNLFGEPYKFQFARKNRPPVLDYLNPIVVDVGIEYEINPTAHDPDEDEVSFTYFGDIISANFSLPAGYYNVTVSASDTALSDFQKVSILVCNLDNTDGQVCKEVCGAHPLCEGKVIGSMLNSCTINAYLEDQCDSQCQIISSNSCIAPSVSSSCKAAEQCNALPQGSVTSINWCYGFEKCESCSGPRVNRFGNESNPDYLPSGEEYQCSCGVRDDFAKCDTKPYNGDFKGECINQVCVGDS